MQEGKVQILMAIHASLSAIAEKAILWAAGVSDADVVVITGVTTNPMWEPGEATPQSSSAHIGSLAPQWITIKFLYPLALPAVCLSASDEDWTSRTEVESSSSVSCGSEPDEVCPHLSDF